METEQRTQAEAVAEAQRSVWAAAWATDLMIDNHEKETGADQLREINRAAYAVARKFDEVVKMLGQHAELMAAWEKASVEEMLHPRSPDQTLVDREMKTWTALVQFKRSHELCMAANCTAVHPPSRFSNMCAAHSGRQS